MTNTQHLRPAASSLVFVAPVVLLSLLGTGWTGGTHPAAGPSLTSRVADEGGAENRGRDVLADEGGAENRGRNMLADEGGAENRGRDQLG